ncbi:MAG: PrsW family glutamic-type intramembrane protease [Acidimicrobiales bacterium]
MSPDDLPVTDDLANLPVLPTVHCPHCGQVVPAGHFCGSCGAHLVHASSGKSAAGRMHSYAAFPDEPLFRISIVSTLFPHLSHRSRVVFRVAAFWLTALLVVLAIARFETALIAVAAVGIPVLFQLYILEVGPYGDDVIIPTFVTLLLGIGLGIGWAQIGGPYVQRNLVPVLQPTLTNHSAFAAAVIVPVVGQLLMFVPVVLLLIRRRSTESLDGFVIGASGALGFTAAATIAELSSQFTGGVFSNQPFVDVISQALIRGISVPLVAAFATGLFGATIWVRRRSGSDRTAAGGLWLTSPVLAVIVALLVQVGLGYTDIARLEQPVVVVVHLAAVVVMAIALRVGLHHVLLHEHHDFAIGAPVTCTHCHHLVPAMPFCPQCGVALHATARSHREREANPIQPGGMTPKLSTAEES